MDVAQAESTAGEAPLLDRTIDVDGHEFAPPHLWGPIFGSAAERIGKMAEPFMAKMGEGYILLPHLTGDDMAMTPENVWNVRTTGAPGSFDMGRRLQAMDLMGVKRQLIFPGYGIFAQILARGHETGGVMVQTMLDMAGGMTSLEAQQLGRAGIDEHNDWAVRTSALDPDRLRAVGMLKDAKHVGEIIDQAKDLVDRGLRGLLMNIGAPPAGCSPASPDFDPLWEMLSERNVTILAHLGADLGFMNSSHWNKAPAFAAGKLGLEVGLDPYSYSTAHLPISNWLSVLVMGGVFERHPNLRFGAIELGGHWLGPLADSLDMWATTIFARRMKGFISKKPSEYIASNVRVSPYNIVEPIDIYMTRYERLSSCYCYSTDYPHVEGGLDIKAKVYDKLKPLGDAMLEKYFVTNGNWLLPP